MHKDKFEKLRSDVTIKLKFLDENKVGCENDNSRKNIRWSAVPVPCLCRFCLKLREGTGQRPLRPNPNCQKEEKEKIPHMCESVGHRLLRGRCPAPSLHFRHNLHRQGTGTADHQTFLRLFPFNFSRIPQKQISVLWLFLDASSHLYKRVCRSVGPSVRPSVHTASAKTAFLGCFWPRFVPALNQMIEPSI